MPHDRPQVEHWPLDRLLPYAANARTHSDDQVAQIAGSIAAFGFNVPCLVDEAGVLIAGHGRLLAARKLELETVPVIRLEHLSEAQARAFRIADNRIAENAGWDEELLRVELEQLREAEFDLDLTGFELDEIDRLLQADGPAGNIDDDEVSEPPENPVTRPGDLWLLGHHRLLCGDATVLGDIERVLDGGLADLCFTDPPYNVDYGNSGKDRMRQETPDPQRQSGRRLRTLSVRRLRQHPDRHQGRGLCLHVVLGTTDAATRVPRGRRALVDLCDLCQEHLHAGPRRLPAPVRADPLWMEGGHRPLLVRRARPGPRLVRGQAGAQRSGAPGELAEGRGCKSPGTKE